MLLIFKSTEETKYLNGENKMKLSQFKNELAQLGFKTNIGREHQDYEIWYELKSDDFKFFEVIYLSYSHRDGYDSRVNVSFEDRSANSREIKENISYPDAISYIKSCLTPKPIDSSKTSDTAQQILKDKLKEVTTQLNELKLQQKDLQEALDKLK